MAKEQITQTDMAKQLGTSRSGLRRLLDPQNTSITLLTLSKAATILGKHIEIVLVPNTQSKKSKAFDTLN
jgi:antitoxin HicB